MKSFVVTRGMRGVVQNKVIRDLIVSNHEEYQSQQHIFKPLIYPRVHWLWLNLLVSGPIKVREVLRSRLIAGNNLTFVGET